MRNESLLTKGSQPMYGFFMSNQNEDTSNDRLKESH